MSLCTAKLLSQLTSTVAGNQVLLQAILDALLTQNDKLNDQAVSLGEGCFTTGAATPEILTTIAVIVDGGVQNRLWTYPDGTPYAGPTPVAADPCDCPCLECTPDVVVKACLFVDLFDTDDGLLQVGQTTQYEIAANAGNVTMVHDYTTSSNGVDKSSFYTPIIAAINSIAGWSIVLEVDTKIGSNTKPTYRITHTGNAPDTLIIKKTPNGDVYKIASDGAGNITGATDDSGSGAPFGSDPFDHPACAAGVDFPTPTGVLWKVEGNNPSWSPMGEWAFDTVAGSVPNGVNGNGIAVFELALTNAGYVVTNPGGNPLVVQEGVTTGKPTHFKWENLASGTSHEGDWVLV